MTPEQEIVNILFQAGCLRRFKKLKDCTDFLLSKYVDMLLYYYKRDESHKAVNSLAYIQLSLLLEKLNDE